MPTLSDIDQYIASAVTGQAASPPWNGEIDHAEFLHRVRLHGVAPLLNQVAPAGWPPAIKEALREEAIFAAMWELRHQQVISAAVTALQSAGCGPIIIKGTALAYSVYANPAHRWRGDTDVLIAPDARACARTELERLGFGAPAETVGEHISHQAPFTLVHSDGSAHTIDLHWKISNSTVLSRCFDHEELERIARPLDALGPAANGVLGPHAITLAAMHRAKHRLSPYWVEGKEHLEPDRLIWLLDLLLLAKSFSTEDWALTISLARSKGLMETLFDALNRANVLLHAEFPIHQLAGRIERSGRADNYLRAGRVRRQLMDLRELGDANAQTQFLRELVFPPASYMQQKYPDASAPLAWLYARRAATGLAKALRRA